MVVLVRGRSFSLYNTMIRRSPAYSRKKRKCMSSKHESVLSVTFRCFALLVKLPLPSLRDNAIIIKNVLMDIVHKAGNTNGHLVTSCFKLLADLLRGFRISLSDNQLLVHTPYVCRSSDKSFPCCLIASQNNSQAKIGFPRNL